MECEQKEGRALGVSAVNVAEDDGELNWLAATWCSRSVNPGVSTEDESLLAFGSAI